MEQDLDRFKGIEMKEFDYSLPEDRIAKFPLENRDESMLLVCVDDHIEETVFYNIADILDEKKFLVFNNTKVIHARMFFRKPTGALIEVFCLEPYEPADYAVSFSCTEGCEWKCIVGNLKKWHEGRIISQYTQGGETFNIFADLICRLENGEVVVRFTWDGDFSFSEVLGGCGQVPIPPYLNREAVKSDEVRYQTVYSKIEGSVAAPTAGLHFTERVLDALKKKGVGMGEVTLHVGAGTFRPVKADRIGGHEMHTEHFEVSADFLKHLIAHIGEVVAVGTTSVRTLESLYWCGVKLLAGKADFNHICQWEVYGPTDISVKASLEALCGWMEKNGKSFFKADTTIIIVPGYRFRIVSYMITNFHQPHSTLLLLVTAAIGMRCREVYKYALEHDFRFLSYGDSNFFKVVNC